MTFSEDTGDLCKLGRRGRHVQDVIPLGYALQEKRVDAEDPKKVFDFYMFVWKIFYAPQFGSDSC